MSGLTQTRTTYNGQDVWAIESNGDSMRIKGGKNITYKTLDRALVAGKLYDETITKDTIEVKKILADFEEQLGCVEGEVDCMGCVEPQGIKMAKSIIAGNNDKQKINNMVRLVMSKCRFNEPEFNKENFITLAKLVQTKTKQVVGEYFSRKEEEVEKGWLTENDYLECSRDCMAMIAKIDDLTNIIENGSIWTYENTETGEIKSCYTLDVELLDNLGNRYNMGGGAGRFIQ